MAEYFIKITIISLLIPEIKLITAYTTGIHQETLRGFQVSKSPNYGADNIFN